RPCRAQRLDQPSGVTFTTVRRPQSAQYRGGSSFLAARQEPCPPPAASCCPQWSQYPRAATGGSGSLIGAQPTPRGHPGRVPGCRHLEGGGSRTVPAPAGYGRLTGPLALITWWKATGGLFCTHLPPELAPMARMLSW